MDHDVNRNWIKITVFSDHYSFPSPLLVHSRAKFIVRMLKDRTDGLGG